MRGHSIILRKDGGRALENHTKPSRGRGWDRKIFPEIFGILLALKNCSKVSQAVPETSPKRLVVGIANFDEAKGSYSNSTYFHLWNKSRLFFSKYNIFKFNISLLFNFWPGLLLLASPQDFFFTQKYFILDILRNIFFWGGGVHGKLYASLQGGKGGPKKSFKPLGNYWMFPERTSLPVYALWHVCKLTYLRQNLVCNKMISYSKLSSKLFLFLSGVTSLQWNV